MTNDVPLQHVDSLRSLLRALAQIGQIAEAMLAEQAAPASRAEQMERESQALPRASTRDDVHEQSAASRPLQYRGSPQATPRPFFTRSAAERLREHYGISPSNMAQTMAALSHQIHGTHLAGLAAVNLGKRLLGDGALRTVWAVEIFHQVGFVATDEDGIIVSALPRDGQQLASLLGTRRAALEAFKKELRLHYADPVFFARRHRRSPASG